MNGIELDHKSTILTLRWLIVLLAILLMIYGERSMALDTRAYLLGVSFFLSNLLLSFVPRGRFVRAPVLSGIVLMDAVFVSLAIYFTSGFNAEFYLIYFLIVFIAAMRQEVKGSILAGAIFIVLYGWLCSRFSSDFDILSTSFLIRAPFFLLVATFSGFLAQTTRIHEETKRANVAMTGDLKAAAQAQLGLLPTSLPQSKNVEFAARFIPSGFVSGDIYNVFQLDKDHIGFYQMDVLGHGVVAAFFSVSLNRRLTQDLHPGGLLIVPSNQSPQCKINSPDRVIALLDEEYSTMLEDQGRYFTILYGVLDVRTGEVFLCRAGHNPPLFVPANGDARYMEDGGLPIGFGLPRLEEKMQRMKLSSGDRIIIFSDGLNEARSLEKGVVYGTDRVRSFLLEHRDWPLPEVFDLLLKDVKVFRGKERFSDDVSILGLTWLG